MKTVIFVIINALKTVIMSMESIEKKVMIMLSIGNRDINCEKH